MDSKIFLTFLLIFKTSFSDVASGQNFPIVTTQTGKVSGTTDASFSSRTFYSFRAIPYAEPPVGQLRFKVQQSFDQRTGSITVRLISNQRYYSEICIHNYLQNMISKIKAEKLKGSITVRLTSCLFFWNKLLCFS